MNQYGRSQIYTGYKEVVSGNLIEVLNKTLGVHTTNAISMQKLIDYEAGKVPLVRAKTYRKDVSYFIPDPLATQIVDFKLGFEWGIPITFKQSDNNPEENGVLIDAITQLNRGYRAQTFEEKQQKLARYIEICGIGYTFVDINSEHEEGDSYFTIDVFDPRTTFVVRSTAYNDKRIILAVSFREDEHGQRFYTCFTKDSRYEVTNGEIVEWQENPIGKIPIIEWVRSHDRQGCFERLIPLINDLTQNISDFSNDITQNTDCVWVTTDVDIKEEVVGEDGEVRAVDANPQSGDWLHIFTTPDGKTPKIEPLTVNHDYNGIQTKIDNNRAHILSLAHVPVRNNDTGGSTGIAMSDASGWTDAEAEANRKQMLTKSSKMEEVKVVIAALKASPFTPVDSPMLKLTYTDVEPSIKRSRNFELTVKSNSVATLLSKGFELEDVVSTIPLFEDPTQVVDRSGEGVRRYQEANVFKINNSDSDKLLMSSDDPAAQITNSPSVDGMVVSEEKVEPIDDGNETG